MGNMNKLAALIDKKRKSMREQEAAPDAKRQETAAGAGADGAGRQAKEAAEAAAAQAQAQAEPKAALQPPAEVKRRLRRLGQPATLFGETDAEREARLQRAQETLAVEDEHTGGQLNEHLQMARERREQARLAQLAAAQPAAAGPQVPAAELAEREGVEEAAAPADPVAADFARAAAALKERLEEERMSVEEKISKYLKRYCTLWGQDLGRRSEAVADSGPGRQATLLHQQTVAAFKPLHQQLAHKEAPPEMVAGLWMYIQDVENRNYLHAYDIYMRLAVGNAPWPIGVTSIGIHDRTAREKISHVMNAAHIMNDEATRKYLQGVKRLLTFMQRAFPSDPSRCVDFDGWKDSGRGAAGGGSDKLALLAAEASGDTAAKLGLLPAPHMMDRDGVSVRVPDKWENMIRRSEGFQEKLAALKSPPKTPPHGGRK